MDDGEFLALQYYQFHKAGLDEMHSLVETDLRLDHPYPEVLVFYNHGQGMLVPGKFHDPEKAGPLLELMLGDLSSGLTLVDEIPEMDAVYLYRALPELHELLSKKYTNISFSHFNTGWLKRRLSHDQPLTRLEAILYPSHVMVVFWAEGRLCLSQYYDYDTPEDVAWSLLNVARQWDMRPDELPLYVSGLVETSSPMYAEIRKYFMHVELEARPFSFRYDPGFDQYPHHFFSPIFSLAT